ncbi:glycosyl hydrolase [Microdochium trichocladiopsis]|uniref:Glycosyl hydrolase n=1 Tax=Microdochium trichocladiopsis TaxID=1682393 RepID=A0A9P9BKF6_9PEZI|nr:glycosyl hydrolase [Microdochium trichocladiopsis]KAH7018466.1 glycosyl hydrolase [Microdochium trichocladiopsis]
MTRVKTWTALQALACLGTLLGQAGLSRADNPIVQTDFTTDPAPMVYNNRLYVFTGQDEDGSTTYNMKKWRLYSTDDMANWRHHGSPLSLATFSWADANAWAPQAIARNGKFYIYVPIRRRGGQMAIGVGVADSIEGPWKDAIGGPLVENAEIDPTVFVDDDGQAYLFWGNPRLAYVRLNADMKSYSGGVNYVTLNTGSFGPRPSPTTQRPAAYEEGPWLYKRNGLYYMVYAANCCSEDIRYSTAPSVTGPWTYRGVVMATEGKSFTNHPGIIDYGGNSYFFYHNGALPGGGGYQRSVSVEGFRYNSDGTIPQLRMSTGGPAQIKSLDPFVRQEAETIAWTEGVEVEACSEGGINVANINNGDYIKVKGVDFKGGASSFTARVSSATSGGRIELRTGSKSGSLVGTCTVPATGGWQTWQTVTCRLSTTVSGVQDLFLVFMGSGTGFLFNINWWQFAQ